MKHWRTNGGDHRVSDAGQVSASKIVVTDDAVVPRRGTDWRRTESGHYLCNCMVLVGCTTAIPVCASNPEDGVMCCYPESAPRAQFAEGRAAKMRHVTASLKETPAECRIRVRSGSQIERTNDRTACRLLRCRRCSTSWSTPIEVFVAAFSPVDHQVGVISSSTARRQGLKLFDAASTWLKLAPKLIRSYGGDAIIGAGGRRGIERRTLQGVRQRGRIPLLRRYSRPSARAATCVSPGPTSRVRRSSPGAGSFTERVSGRR